MPTGCASHELIAKRWGLWQCDEKVSTASRFIWPRISPASTTPRCGRIPSRAARSSSTPSCTWPQTAERGLFDFFFLAEGLRLREHRGRIHDLDVVGRPDTFTVLAALAAVTDRLGLTGTINTTFNEPFEVARQFATLDHLSDGRAGWNMVTSSDAFTGENFRRGGFLDHPTATSGPRSSSPWPASSGTAGHPTPCSPIGTAESTSTPAGFVSSNIGAPQFDVRGVSTLPRRAAGPSRAAAGGDSADGRAFLAKYADAAFTMHSTLEAGQAYYADVKAPAAPSHGRDPDRLKVFPAATFVLGDTAAEAADKAPRHPAPAGRPADRDRAARAGSGSATCPAYDPDGPLPDVEPADDPTDHQGRVRHGDPKAVAAAWRERAEAEQPVHSRTGHRRHQPPAVRRHRRADRRRDRPARAVGCLRRVHPGAPPDRRAGSTSSSTRWCSLLQERGSFRTEYTGHTAGPSRHIGWPAGVVATPGVEYVLVRRRRSGGCSSPPPC